MLEWMREIFGDAYTEDLDKKVSKKIGELFVARSDFNARTGELETARNKITEHEGTIATLQAAKTNAEDLQKTVDSLNGQITSLKRTAALEKALSALGVTDPGYVIYKQGGVDRFTFDKDGKPEKLEDVIAPMREQYAHLFTPAAQNYSPAGGGTPTANPFAKDTWNLTEQGKMLRDNPAAARELAAAAGVKI